MKGLLLILLSFSSNYLLSQNLYNFLNDEFKTNLLEKSKQIEGNLIIYATDFNNSILINPSKLTNIDTLFTFDDDINILLAAISLKLFDNDKFNINSYLTALIPGSTEPYLPISDDYNFPFKNELTAINLLQQRSGLYNLFLNKADSNYYFIYSNPNYNFIIDSLVSQISKNKLTIIDPNVNFNYNKLNYFLIAKILNRITENSLITIINNKICDLLNKPNFTINNNITPYLLGLFYRNIIKNEKIIPKRLTNNYLLGSLSVNNYYVEYAMGTFYYKKIGYGNINIFNNSARLSIYIPSNDIFLLITLTNTEIDKEEFLSSYDIDKILSFINKIKINKLK